jgi:hypothetical protein
MRSKKYNIYGVDRTYAEKGVSGYVQIFVETPTRTYVIHVFDEKAKTLLKDLEVILREST